MTDCNWKINGDGHYDTGCGELFEFIADGPTENNFRFCPYCGGKLVEQTQRCACGVDWHPDMDQFGCWSCGADRPVSANRIEKTPEKVEVTADNLCAEHRRFPCNTCGTKHFEGCQCLCCK